MKIVGCDLQRCSGSSAEVLEVLPENGPGLQDVAADEDVALAVNGLIVDTVAIGDVTRDDAGFKVPCPARF
jgi:hypothetical protein